MHALRSLTTGQRRLLLALFACAMVLRVAVPVGWMPMHDDRGFHLTLCSGMGPMTMPMGAHHAMDGHAHPMPAGQGQDGDPHHHPCTGAGVAAAIAPPLLAAVAAALLRPGVAGAGFSLTVTIGRGLAAPPPPQTGPPSIG